MKFEASLVISNGATGPDPDAGAVGRNKLLLLNPRDPGADVPNQAVTFFLEGAAGETVTIDLWAVREEAPKRPMEPTTPDPVPSERFALIASGVVITARVITQVHLKGIAGAVLPEVTAETIAADRTLYAAGSPNVIPPTP